MLKSKIKYQCYLINWTNKMYKNTPNDNMSKIIYLSNIYQRHRKNLMHIKPLVNTSNKKFNQRNSDYLVSRAKNTQAVRRMKQKQLQRENQGFVKRVVQKSIQPSRISHGAFKRPNSKSPERQRETISNGGTPNNKKRTLSASSARSVSSIRNLINRQKQIQRQNNILQDRITKSQFKDGLGPKAMNESYQKRQYYKNLRSRYSNQNKSLLEEMISGLNVKRKNAQFLPQIVQTSQIRKHNSVNIYKKQKNLDPQKNRQLKWKQQNRNHFRNVK